MLNFVGCDPLFPCRAGSLEANPLAAIRTAPLHRLVRRQVADQRRHPVVHAKTGRLATLVVGAKVRGKLDLGNLGIGCLIPEWAQTAPGIACLNPLHKLRAPRATPGLGIANSSTREAS